MNKYTRIWRDKKDGIHDRVKNAIIEEIALCERDYGIKLKVLNLDSLMIGYSKFPEPSIDSDNLRRDEK